MAQAFRQIRALTNASSPWYSANGTNMTTGPLGGTLITDHVRLRYYEALHGQVIAGLNNGSAVPVTGPNSTVNSTVDLGNGMTNPLTERQIDPIKIAGLSIEFAIGVQTELEASTN